jgi:hypothetical protein
LLWRPVHFAGKSKRTTWSVLVLADRAASEDPRSTRAIEDQPGYPLKNKTSKLGKIILPPPSLLLTLYCLPLAIPIRHHVLRLSAYFVYLHKCV